MQIRTYALGPLQTNGYLLSSGGQAVFIDPGGDPASVLDVIRQENLTLTHVLITHLHFDHIYGAAKLARETGATIAANTEDGFLLETEVGAGGAMGLPKVELFDFAPIAPGAATFVGEECQIVATPGHTPGSLTFVFPGEGAAFVGDLIFARSIGRTDFPGGSTPTLVRSVEQGIFTLPEDTTLYPGHGPATSVGDEKAHNPFFQPGAPGMGF
ncbi:MBL fold metallo-hydrolase [Desulfobaculum senezii]